MGVDFSRSARSLWEETDVYVLQYRNSESLYSPVNTMTDYTGRNDFIQNLNHLPSLWGPVQSFITGVSTQWKNDKSKNMEIGRISVSYHKCFGDLIAHSSILAKELEENFLSLGRYGIWGKELEISNYLLEGIISGITDHTKMFSSGTQEVSNEPSGLSNEPSEASNETPEASNESSEASNETSALSNETSALSNETPEVSNETSESLEMMELHSALKSFKSHLELLRQDRNNFKKLTTVSRDGSGSQDMIIIFQ